MATISTPFGSPPSDASRPPPCGAECDSQAMYRASSPAKLEILNPASTQRQQHQQEELPRVMGRRMKMSMNRCPSELRRPVANPYVVIQKCSKSHYAKKQYWAKVYEVEYALIKDPRSEIEEMVDGTKRKAFVAATGDEIGLYGEGTNAEEAASELQARLSSSILQWLEEGMSHCLPSKRKYQDVLLKDFEEEMVSHGVRLLAPPKYVPIKVSFDTVSMGGEPKGPDQQQNGPAATDGEKVPSKDSQEQADSPPPIVNGANNINADTAAATWAIAGDRPIEETAPA